MPLKIRTSIATIAFISAATLACGRGEETAPPAQSQATTADTLNSPATVTGCLRAGESAGTFVLTTSQADQGAQPATYQLTGTAGVNLMDHIGDRVEVTGIILDQQHVATTDSRTPAKEQAEGTSGASVQTGTQLAVRRMEVKQVRNVGGECEPGK